MTISMAERWMQLGNGADAWFALEEAEWVPNFRERDIALRFPDGTGGYLRDVRGRTRDDFIEAHRRKRPLTDAMVQTMVVITKQDLIALKRNWLSRIVRIKEIVICEVYIDSMCKLFNLQVQQNDKGGVNVVPLDI